MSDDRRAPIQGEYSPDERKHYPAGSITWEEHLAVWDAYDKKWRCGQSAERVAERCGFGHREAEELLGRPLATFRPREVTP